MTAPANTQLVTIRHIATALGMSHSTVSRALSDHPGVKAATRLKVQALARELGYVPNGFAQSMRAQHGPVVGLVVPDIQNDFYASVAQIVADAAASRGLHMALSITEDDPEREMGDLRALVVARAVGVIVTLCAQPRPETLELLAGVNAVQLVRQAPQVRHEAVLIDDQQGVAMATRHLVHYGHRDIAYVGSYTAISCGADRLQGFRGTMQEHGLDASRVSLGPPRPEFSHHAVTALMQGPTRPTGLVMGSSSLTMGALKALRASGLHWPRDVSVVGYGDPAWFDLVGDGLTTVRLPVQDMGRCAVSLLLSRGTGDLAAGAQVSATRFAPALVVRGSTMPLR